MWSKLHKFARLACVRHAASVQSEPESNSPVNNLTFKLTYLRSTLAESQFNPLTLHLSKNRIGIAPAGHLARFALFPFRDSLARSSVFCSKSLRKSTLFFISRKSFLSPAERKKVNRYNLLQRTRRLFLSGERSYPPLSRLRQLFFYNYFTN